MKTENIDIEKQLEAAAKLLGTADGLIIIAGAGMGIDSGLPDFRSKEGFWNAYPALGKLGINFMQIANPEAFKIHPEIAWGFYGHRLQLYRDTIPHQGFQHLLTLAKKLTKGVSVYTSNVDGQFQKAGFNPLHVTECHGSIHYLQCMVNCGQAIWPATDIQPVVDNATCTLLSPLPTCPSCGKLARPNILMFNDWNFAAERYEYSYDRLIDWVENLHSPVVMELGAGIAIPTARNFYSSRRHPLIRINPNDYKVGFHNNIGIPLGAKEALTRIMQLLK